MFKRLKETILEIIQQADLILLGLCCAASVFGIAMIYSATRYNNDNRKIIVQTAALLIGIVAYFGISMIDLEMLIKRWKWIAAFDVLFILLLKTPFGVSRDAMLVQCQADNGSAVFLAKGQDGVQRLLLTVD